MKNFGFGCMRLPMKDGEVDAAEFSRMTDSFLAAGFTYFDTAHGYISGKSETAIRACLTSRHPREAYTLTDKLTENYFEKEEDILPFFESQLRLCGVKYFDWYLMHAQNGENYKKFVRCGAYRIAGELKAQGKIRHVGISFHDTPEVLERILTEQPGIEVVQLQLNYVDWDNPNVQSRECLEVCNRFQKPVIVMEPVKGGSLMQLPEAAGAVFDALGGGRAEYAIRFAASCPGVMVVLSGMSDMAQMEQNIGFMRDFRPLNAQEHSAVEQVRDIFRTQERIPCTACRYCTDGCPQRIPIPDIFACSNDYVQHRDWSVLQRYIKLTRETGKAGDCVKCGACEAVCPQHLEIRRLLEEAAETFDKD